MLKQGGLLSRWKSKPSRKGTGFEQPLQPHQHWHVDVSDLMAESQVLKFEDSARAKDRMQGGEERREKNQHRRKEL